MRLLKALVSASLCLVSSTAALVAPLKARTDATHAQSKFTYEVVPGVFIQDDPTTVPSQVGAIPPSFGLIDQSGFRWAKLKFKVWSLNFFSGPKVQYKLLFCGRHGEGYHNVAEALYGTQLWDDYWSKLNGDGNITWGPDAEITPRGREQAKNATAAWTKELPQGIPVPDVVYSSPLSRAAETARITFAPWWFNPHRKGKVLEGLREVMGVHTCDKRRTKTYITQTYGDILDIVPPFSEDDELWQAEHRETNDEIDVRTKTALDYIFNGQETYVAIVAHSGAINSIWRNINHIAYSVPTGGVVPVLVKATKA